VHRSSRRPGTVDHGPATNDEVGSGHRYTAARVEVSMP
jgi:hypothetical protein